MTQDLKTKIAEASSTRLRTSHLDVLRETPDWIGVGLPAKDISDASGRSRQLLPYLHRRGYVSREKPNEEWPFIYALTDKGRAMLQASQPKTDGTDA